MSALDTWHEALIPLFVTSKAVTPELVDEFLQTAADNVSIPENYVEFYAFTLQRQWADAEPERERVEAMGHPMRGIRPPVGPHPNLDFEGATVDELARYVLEHFATDEVEHQNGEYVETMDQEARAQKKTMPHIDNDYFVVLDERSAQDHSVILVKIPHRLVWDGRDPATITRRTRDWIPRENYTDAQRWEDDDDNQEMKAVRLKFKEVPRIQELKMGQEGIEDFADQVDENGVFSEESRQEWGRKYVQRGD